MAFSLCGLLAGCGGFAPGLIGERQPEVRIFNAVDGKSITVSYADAYGNLLGTSNPVGYQQTSSSNLIIANTTATPTVSSGGTTLFKGTSNLYQINAHYTLYVGGTTGTYVELPLNDNQGEGPTAGSAQLRAVHIGTNTAAVDVYVVPSGSGVNGVPLASGLTYAHVTAGGNTTGTIDGNGYISDAITTNTAYDVILTTHNSTVAIAQTTITLGAQSYYTVAVYDSGNTAGVQVLKD